MMGVTILSFNKGNILPLRDFVTGEVTNVELPFEVPGSLNDFANEIFMLMQEYPRANIKYQFDNGVINSQTMFSLSKYVGPPDSSVPVWEGTTLEIRALGGIVEEEPLWPTEDQSEAVMAEMPETSDGGQGLYLSEVPDASEPVADLVGQTHCGEEVIVM